MADEDNTTAAFVYPSSGRRGNYIKPVLPEDTNNFRDDLAALGKGAGLSWLDNALARYDEFKGGDYNQSLTDSVKRARDYAQVNPGRTAVLEGLGSIAPTLAVEAALRRIPILNRLGKPLSLASNARTSPLRDVARLGITGGVVGAAQGAGEADDRTIAEGAAAERARSVQNAPEVIGNEPSAAWKADSPGYTQSRSDAAMDGAMLGTVLGPLGLAAKPIGAVWRGIKSRLPTSPAAADKEAMDQIYNAMIRSGGTPDSLRALWSKYDNMGLPANVSNLAPGHLDRLATAVAGRPGGEALAKSAQAQTGLRGRLVNRLRENLNAGNFKDDLAELNGDFGTEGTKLYTKAREHGVVTDPAVLELLKKYPQYQETGAGGKYAAEMASLAGDPKLDFSKPTVELLHRMKVAMGHLIDAERNVETGKLSGKGTSMVMAQRDLLKTLDAAVPDYKIARAYWESTSSLKESLDKGRKYFMKMDYEDVADLTRDLSKADLQAFKTGVFRQLEEAVFAPTKDLSAAVKFTSSPGLQRKLMPLFESDSHFNLFKEALEMDVQMHHAAQAVIKNAGRSQARQTELALGLTTAPNPLDTLTPDIGRIGGLYDVMLRAFRHGAINEETAHKLANILQEREPEAVAAVFKALEGIGAERGAEQVISRAAQTVAGPQLLQAGTPSARGNTDNAELPTPKQIDDDIEAAIKRYTPER